MAMMSKQPNMDVGLTLFLARKIKNLHKQLTNHSRLSSFFNLQMRFYDKAVADN